jgi:hypothetical protein
MGQKKQIKKILKEKELLQSECSKMHNDIDVLIKYIIDNKLENLDVKLLDIMFNHETRKVWDNYLRTSIGKNYTRASKIVNSEFMLTDKQKEVVESLQNNFNLYEKETNFMDNLKRNPNLISNIEKDEEGDNNLIYPERYQSLFNLLSQEHNLIPTVSQMDDIITECQKFVDFIEGGPVLKEFVKFNINLGDKFVRSVDINADGVMKTKITYPDQEGAPKT